MALDHPDRSARLAVLDIISTGMHFVAPTPASPWLVA